jgi:hypothetical protein
MRRYVGPHSEATLQLQVADYLRRQYPNALWRSDYASGLRLTMAQAVQHKRLQSGRGWPDLQIMEPSHVDYGDYYYGLFIELKRDGVVLWNRDGTLRKDQHLEEQAKTLADLRDRGFEAQFAVGFDQARALIDAYMTGAGSPF